MYRTDNLNILKSDFLQPRNYFIGCKLVRGAYYNQDYKYNILFDKIEDTHYNYDSALTFFSKNNKLNDNLICATHNENSIDLAVDLIKNNQFVHSLRCQKLHQVISKLILCQWHKLRICTR